MIAEILLVMSALVSQLIHFCYEFIGIQNCSEYDARASQNRDRGASLEVVPIHGERGLRTVDEGA